MPDQHVQYVIVNEAGASVYSASKLASEEFPKFDVGQRCGSKYSVCPIIILYFRYFQCHCKKYCCIS
ncbi:Uncharacterised protein [Dorea longicatena]|nr:Uncharacterised protein [Dorea longicatena]